ncbi:unnamed protein product [Microthlaspi erraticum]|uniref:Uncharacterized protein n=1 Tax=Microthlaspi erraticum TaxID=1685480 RepID=A0A6D2KXS9_9BRAS|nr:unnamed protein product [Microthlaspi erraticum]
MEKDQSEIKASTGLGNDSSSEEKTLKRKREEEEPISDLREAEIVFPFAKTLSEWKEYEEKWAIPQRPHFAPLIHFHGVLREKCALVLMKAFEDMVAALMEDVPRSSVFLYQYQEALLQLEDNGFNAKLGLARIDELLSLNHEPPNPPEEQKGEPTKSTGGTRRRATKSFGGTKEHMTRARCKSNGKCPL